MIWFDQTFSNCCFHFSLCLFYTFILHIFLQTINNQINQGYDSIFVIVFPSLCIISILIINLLVQSFHFNILSSSSHLHKTQCTHACSSDTPLTGCIMIYHDVIKSIERSTFVFLFLERLTYIQSLVERIARFIVLLEHIFLTISPIKSDILIYTLAEVIQLRMEDHFANQEQAVTFTDLKKLRFIKDASQLLLMAFGTSMVTSFNKVKYSDLNVIDIR